MLRVKGQEAQVYSGSVDTLPSHLMVKKGVRWHGVREQGKAWELSEGEKRPTDDMLKLRQLPH